MQGKTHNMVGMACALTAAEIMHAGDVPLATTILCAAAGSFGGLIPDIDSKNSSIRKKFRKSLTRLVLMLIFFAILDQMFHIGILHQIAIFASNIRMLIGGTLLLGIYLYGMTTPHRTFMHSVTILLASSFCMLIAFPSAMTLYYAVGYASHLLTDWPNRRKEQLLWPLSVAHTCLDICDADDPVVNYVICGISTIIVILLVLL